MASLSDEANDVVLRAVAFLIENDVDFADGVIALISSHLRQDQVDFIVAHHRDEWMEDVKPD